MRAGGRTDITKLIVAIRNSSNAPKNVLDVVYATELGGSHQGKHPMRIFGPRQAEVQKTAIAA